MKPVLIGNAALYHGDCRDLLGALPDASADLCLADPPYGDTSLEWDSIVDGWLPEAARVHEALHPVQPDMFGVAA